MAELVAVGGAELPDAVDGPARAEVYHHEMDGTSFTEYFPWELTNTDYYRRVLAQVGYSLRALVAATVKAHGVVVVVTVGGKRWIDWVKLKITRPKVIFQTENKDGEIGCDAQTLIKHVLHRPHIKFYASLLNVNDQDLKDTLDNLKTGRNDFAHMSLASDTRWLTKPKMESIFKDALFVVKLAGAYLGNSPNYAEENMKSLFGQWEKHRKSKFARRLARTVFVRVLKENVTEDHLRTASEQCNLAVAQTLVEKNSLGRIGYVEFAEAGDVTKACTGKLLKKQLLKNKLGGSALKVTQSTKYLSPKPPVSTPAPAPSGPLGVNSDRCRVVF